MSSKLINAKHKVVVENLKLYPAKFRCRGCIVNDPRNTKFKSPHSQDSERQWSCRCMYLQSSATYTMNHVEIIPICNGTDLINTVVKIDWPHPGQSESVSLSLNCSTNL